MAAHTLGLACHAPSHDIFPEEEDSPGVEGIVPFLCSCILASWEEECSPWTEISSEEEANNLCWAV